MNSIQKLNLEFWEENREKRSLWPVAYLLGATDLVPLPRTQQDALSKCLVNGHAKYLPDNSAIVLDALLDGNGRNDQVSCWVPDDSLYFTGDQVLSSNAICTHVQKYLSVTTQPSTSSNVTTQSELSSVNRASARLASKTAGAKQGFGLQVEVPLHTLDPSKPTVLHVLDILDDWTAEQLLAKITSEMGINPENHQIVYKTSKMKVKDNAIIIDCAETLAAGLEVQCQIQSRAHEQKHMKIFNLSAVEKTTSKAKGKKPSTRSDASPPSNLRKETFKQLIKSTWCNRHSRQCYPHPKADWEHLFLSNKVMDLWANHLSQGTVGVTLERPPQHKAFDGCNVKRQKRSRSLSPLRSTKRPKISQSPDIERSGNTTLTKRPLSMSPLHSSKRPKITEPLLITDPIAEPGTSKTTKSVHVNTLANATAGPSSLNHAPNPITKPGTFKITKPTHVNPLTSGPSTPKCAPLIDLTLSPSPPIAASPSHIRYQRQVKRKYHSATVVDIPSSPCRQLLHKRINSPPITYLLVPDSGSEDDIGFDVKQGHTEVEPGLVELSSDDELVDAVDEA
ncbi:uncharacterized protein EI90DRAFT_3124343 [Cantharellus anzutake]|uniref:uncharacterized protein n=1 Tax=Cantharellus anzutake TaxID=1750568 RepID=UPI00190719A0|nr:uncharacterized protein EI90DRAFT_3124343 [Cantharellus anzutake]KAF8330308.1 hypothetical protein EI90DRAFT_3124343 [Cantharellus anzutake]